ncbi:hypothetical protein [Actinomadura atramentaria]|uniref:hypothetical protein n=1 Tax=Actinomadura atramentaria TaxID=1990 RepID=UPI00036B706B|nr:hypothetical protein [Actinomadura atramentaria]
MTAARKPPRTGGHARAARGPASDSRKAASVEQVRADYQRATSADATEQIRQLANPNRIRQTPRQARQVASARRKQTRGL